MAVEGTTTKEVFESYVEHLLAPELEPGRVVDGQPLKPTGPKGEGN
jgi:hypothetical protein